LDHACRQELAETRARLEEHQIRTEAMINSLAEGLIVIDEQGIITRVNTYALTALGYQEDQLLGQWFPKAITAVNKLGQPVDRLARPITRALTTGETVTDYTYYQRQDGSIIPVTITVSPILMYGRPAGAIEVFRDLTKDLQLDIAKDEFVSLASHQLRTPATGVMMILSMLIKGDFGPLNDLQHKYLEKAIQSNDRQLQIIEDLLNAARVDAGKMQLDLEYIDIVPLIREVISDHAEAFARQQQALELDLPESCRLLGDAQKLRMVLDNLVSNASKYSKPQTSISIQLLTQNDHATMSITDQGVGIAPEDLPRLYTKFSRLTNELSGSVSGTGLGLFLAKGIVELHRGSLTSSSRLGKGSTFTIRLPLRRRSRPSPAAANPPAASQKAAS
jgi:PAS domain S-box-containing protein